MIFRPTWPVRPVFANPFAGMDQIRREMLRLFDALGNQERDDGAGVFPPMNVSQDDERFYVRAEVPGVKASDLSITALRNQLTIAGERKIPAEASDVSWHRRERADGAFSRTITLPTEVDVARVDARCVHGVLTIELTKAEKARPRQIVVKD